MSCDIPERLGKYSVLREINRGSMGIVYLGHDPFLDRPVALKVAHPEQLHDEASGARYRRMFFNEAHTAGRLTHPNIISIFDAGVDAEICYIVMEYVEGGATLKPFCRGDNLLPIEKVVEIVFKCAKALDYAHRQGVVHRDIKPTNLLLTVEKDIKIGDFSIAHMSRVDSTATLPLGLAGSPRYMSPEQITEETLTNQTDIFSLGLVMYELLSGRHPFAAETFSRLLQRILNDTPIPLQEVRSGIGDELASIVAKALAKDRAQRYQMGGELAADLSKAFANLLDKPRENTSEREKFRVTQQLAFFHGFPESEIWEILHAGVWQQVSSGAEIVVEGERDDAFFVIVAGEVTVRKQGQALCHLQTGDCFGEMGYLSHASRTATIVARQPTSLLKLNAAVIHQVSLNCQVRFLKVFLRTLIHRLSVTTEQALQ